MNLRRLTVLGLALAWLALAPLAAETATEPKAPAPTPAATAEVIYPRANPAPAPGVLPTKGSSSASWLVAALVLAAAGGWLFWRARHTVGGGVATRHLAITETKSLGNRQYLVVASYQDKKFLLGVCPGRIDLLTPLDTPETRRP